MSLVFLWVFPSLFSGSAQAVAPSDTFMGWYLFMWGLFTIMYFLLVPVPRDASKEVQPEVHPKDCHNG